MVNVQLNILIENIFIYLFILFAPFLLVLSYTVIFNEKDFLSDTVKMQADYN